MTGDWNKKEFVSRGSGDHWYFSVLIFIMLLIGGLPFAPNPVLTFYMPLGSALLAGPVFLLLAAKVPRHGPLAIAGILTGLIYFATGMHWAMNTAYMVLGVVADLVAGIGKFRSKALNTLAYMLFSLDPAGWSTLILKGGTDTGYIETMNASAQGWMPALILIGTLAVAAFSGWVGSRLLRKQFEKAGITA